MPIIINIIGDSKESSVLVSGKNYIRAIEQQILSKNIKEEFNPQVCIIQEDGNIMCDGDKPFTVKVSGSKPTSGEIKFNNRKITEVTEMILDGYVLEMELDKDLIIKGTTDILEPPLDPKGTYLMKSFSGNATSTFLGGDITKESVESITVTYTNKVPSNAIGSWDASAAKDGSIMTWYTDKDNNNLYELYIGGEGGVKANPTSSYLFYYFTNITTIDVSYLDTSNVTDMSKMFQGCSSLIELDLNNFDTTKVTNMYRMFRDCSSLTNLDINNFKTDKVTDMSGMFANCSKLATLNLSLFNTSKVTNMENMFSGCSSLIELDLNNFDTSQVTTMSNMFSSCSSLTTIKGIEKFNTSQVTNMYCMFIYCSKLATLNLSLFNTSKVTNMRSMFSGCSSLIELDLNNFDTGQVVSMNNMFSKCSSLTTIKGIEKFNTSQVTDMSWMFQGCSKLVSINMKSATFESVTNYNLMLNYLTDLTSIIVKNSDAKIFIEARLVDANKTGVTVTIA